MQPRKHPLVAPILFVFVAACAVALMGYAWWTERQRHPPLQVAAVDAPRAAAAPAMANPPPSRSARVAAAAHAPGPSRATTKPASQAAPQRVQKCIGADEVPIYTSGACPDGSRLEREIAVEIARDAVRPAPFAAPLAPGSPPPQVVVLPVAGHDPYAIPSRKQRGDIELERAWDRCERAKVDQQLRLQRLGNDRTIDDIRRIEKHTENICAEYQLLGQRRR